jgi:hypothetical protein
MISKYNDLKSDDSLKSSFVKPVLQRSVSDPDKVDQMAQITGLEKDNCHFYLESMSWDLAAAVEMWEGLNKPN